MTVVILTSTQLETNLKKSFINIKNHKNIQKWKMINRAKTKSILLLEITIFILVGIIMMFTFFNINLSENLESIKTSNNQLEKQVDLLNDDIENIKNISEEVDLLIFTNNTVESIEISKEELLTLTINSIKTKTKIKKIEFGFKDRTYKTYKFKDISDILKESNFPEYNKFYDCDDFSIATISDSRKKLQGLTIAYIKLRQTDGTYHALNGFLDSDGDFWIYEPQDKYISKLEDLEFSEILSIDY